MLAQVGPDALSLEAVHRFGNNPLRLPDGLHWNLGELYQQVLVGLRRAVRLAPDLISVGIDSWAVDYGLLAGDRLLGLPYHYRDERTAAGVDAVHARIDPAELYAINGLQFLPFNTIYQLMVDAEQGALHATDTFLMLPDLLGFWLTGRRVAELSNASTTGLLDASNSTWHLPSIDRLGLPAEIFPDLVAAGTTVGPLLPAVASDLGSRAGITVVAVGSHDTASAVAAIPLQPGAAYISSGTWSLIGVELDQPVLTEQSRAANFTNEGGVDGRIRYLHNVMGLWILSEAVRTWEQSGESIELTALLSEAAEVTAAVPIFDADDAAFLAPGDMPARIDAWCHDHGQVPPKTRAEYVRSILESLATAYATVVDQCVELTGRPIHTINVVGGGSLNTLLCQLTADRTGRTVLAGPVEATAIGNVLIQARAAGILHGTLEDLRALVARTFPPTTYEPSGG